MGVSAIRYFIDGASMEEAKQAFENARREGPPPELMSGDDTGFDDDAPDAKAATAPRPDDERD